MPNWRRHDCVSFKGADLPFSVTAYIVTSGRTWGYAVSMVTGYGASFLPPAWNWKMFVYAFIDLYIYISFTLGGGQSALVQEDSGL